MPMYERSPEFMHDLERLTPEQRLQFEAAVREMVEDLKARRPFRASLGIKRFHKRPHACEMSWAGDGRALFEYGTSPHQGDVHIIWLAVGTHDIYSR
jgi:transposase